MFKGKKRDVESMFYASPKQKYAGYIPWIEAGWISQQNLSKLAISSGTMKVSYKIKFLPSFQWISM